MADPSGLSVLIVDDQASARTLLRANLEYLGFNKITESGDGVEAFKHLMHSPTQLVISDLTMPKADGLVLLEAIRKQPTLEKTPFIMLTSHGEADTVMKAQKLNVSSYLVKPFTVATLKRRIEEVLGPMTQSAQPDKRIVNQALPAVGQASKKA
jgi:two-component system, chemotaxis family, chemotaxis protein CheY